MTHHLFHLEKLTGMKTNFITEIYDGRCLHLSCCTPYSDIPGISCAVFQNYPSNKYAKGE